MKKLIKNVPVLGPLAVKAYRKYLDSTFSGSADYWEKRYAKGGDSGRGSYDHLAQFKAEVLNKFVDENNVQTVIEFGSGDGNQLKLASYPNYIGFDISSTAVEMCQKMFAGDESKSFKLMSEYNNHKADLTLSLDVIYHLVEDEVYENYMQTLFDASKKYVTIYSSNTDDNSNNDSVHVKNRKFTDWTSKNRPDWELIKQVPNKFPYDGDYTKSSIADFFIFEKR